MTDTQSWTSVPGLDRPSDPGVPGTPSTPSRTPRPATPSRWWGFVPFMVAALAMAASTRSDAAPVAAATPDAVLTALYVGVCTLAGARARPWALLVFAGAGAAAATTDGGLPAAIVALVLAATIVLVPALGAAPWRGALGAGSGALAASSFLWGTELRLGWAVGLGVLGTLMLWGSALGATRGRTRTAVVLVGVFAVLGALAATGAWGAAAFTARTDADEGVNRLQDGLDAAQEGDTERAADELRAASDALRAARATLDEPWARPAKHLPLVGPNARAVDEVAALAARLAGIAERAARAADLNTIAAEAGSIDLNALADVEAALTELDTAVTDARRRLAALDSPWLAGPLVDKLDEARVDLDDAAPSLTNALDAVRAAPVLLGQGPGARYLVLFVTPVEARGRTGFPGNWAEVIAIDGQVRMTRFGRLVELNNIGVPRDERTITGLDEYLVRYGQFLPAQFWQNIGLTPDVPTQAAAVAQLYPQSGGGKLDGVITIDPAGLTAMLQLTGPVEVEGVNEPIGATNAFDFLTRRQYIEFANENNARIDLLELVGRATFAELVSMELPGLRDVADVLGDTVAKGHIRFVSFDDRVKPLLARTNVDGAMAPIVGDDISVITNNAGGNKIDLFLQRTLTYDVRWNPTTGAVEGTLDIALKNNAPATGLPKSLIGNAIENQGPFQSKPPSGTNRMWLSVFSAFAPTSVVLDGQPTIASFGTEVGRRVTSLNLDIGPGATRTLRLTWRGTIAPGAPYELGLPAQPLVLPDQVKVRVTIDDGTNPARTVDGTATLDRDRRIEVPAP